MSDSNENAHEAALRELLDEARRTGNSRSAPRRHHLVPEFYLRGWADDGKLRVIDVDNGKWWPSTPRNAANEAHFYRIESAELDPDDVPPLLFEVVLNRIEGWGKGFITGAIDDPVGVLRDDELRVLFSLYMAFQFVRGRRYRLFLRESLTDGIKLAYGEITHEGIRRELVERGLEPNAENIALFRCFVDDLNRGDVAVGPEKAAAIGMSGQLAVELGSVLFARDWRIYQVPTILLTCDEPVIPIAGPPHPRVEAGGLGAAGVVIFPLTPGLLLAMFDGFNAAPAPPLELGPRDISQLNREIAASASRFVFERPCRNVALQFRLPKAPATYSRAEPTRVDEAGERYLIRAHRPSRWANAKRPPPWPVERWFRPAQ